MKKIFGLVFLLLFSTGINAQFSVRGSLGLNFTTVPSVRDYINTYYAPPGEKLGDVQSAPEFSAEAGYRTGDSEIALELAYEINSFNYTVFLNPYKYNYGLFMPTLIYYKVITGTGYRLQFGGGIGYRHYSVDETLPFTTVATTYTAGGFGVLLRAAANTAIGTNAYAFIGVDLRYNKLGAPESNGKLLRSVVSPDAVEPNSISAGLKLGVAYEF